MKSKKTFTEFDEIVRMIEQSRSRAFQKVNEELVLLYFSVGKIVSGRVVDGAWGNKTVDELSAYIMDRISGLKGFTRRGLYRMKQFYETYSPDSECYNLWLEVQGPEKLSQIVPSVVTQIQSTEYKHNTFVTTVLTQLQWSSHLQILSKTSSPEEKLFYLSHSIKENIKK